ncbi:MAG: LysR family transcriptional regulator [Myxococcales bacterium]
MDLFVSMSVFVAVADLGSFAAVAEQRGLSPTMVANHVRALEARLGERLIDRTTRKHQLTEVGLAYLERCRDVLASAQAADRVGEALRAKPQGLLRVTAPVSYGAHRLTPVISDYLRAFPEVQVDLQLNDRVVDLVEEGFDIGIRSGRLRDDSIVALPLADSHMIAAATPSYLKQHGPPKHPRDLERHNCIAFAAWGPNHSWRFTRNDETIAVPVRGQLVCNNGQALLAAALSHFGVIVQADVLLEPLLESGALLRLLPGWALPTRAVFVVRRSDVRPSAKVRSFVDFVKVALHG